VRHRLAIWGAGGHALVVADIIRLRNEYDVVGFVDDVPQREEETFCGLPLFAGGGPLSRLKDLGVSHLIFGFGDCDARLALSDTVRAAGFALATAIHPRAVIASDVSVGAGTVIAARAVVNLGSVVGENVNIAPWASVDQQCTIHDGAHLSPGVYLSSTVTVGRAAWLGIGAIVTDGVRIGAGVLVGAGALVMEDVPERVLVYG
jgi:sugar O-acyltransferase (sialic acid O-acetyltransferase NeuD family)